MLHAEQGFYTHYRHRRTSLILAQPWRKHCDEHHRQKNKLNQFKMKKWCPMCLPAIMFFKNE
jgi:hypothetical protein